MTNHHFPNYTSPQVVVLCFGLFQTLFWSETRALKEKSIMKKGIHPKYYDCTVRCSCGNTFETRATKPDLKIELCNACHPFYTGQQKFVDTGGRVQRFTDKFGSAASSVAQREADKRAAKQAVAEAAEAAARAAREEKVAAKAAKTAQYAEKAAKRAADPSDKDEATRDDAAIDAAAETAESEGASEQAEAPEATEAPEAAVPAEPADAPAEQAEPTEAQEAAEPAEAPAE